MRGRGIGTARGRATIMRGTLLFSILDAIVLTRSFFSQRTVRHYLRSPTLPILTLLFTARRGRGVPAPRGIRR